MSRSILVPGESYTFSRYFELPYPTSDILQELGYGSVKQNLILPTFAGAFESQPLQASIEESIKLVDLTNETARREVIIAPILLYVSKFIRKRLRIEYPININEQLKGNVDYLLEANRSLLVVEAKQSDLSRGFTQLAVELIAVSQWSAIEADCYYGAITTGDVWKFGIFQADTQTIFEDINLYTVPNNLAKLLEILLGILL
jgi:hypothetical protein